MIGELEGKAVLVMQGRSHFYEGYPITQIGFPIRVMRRLGIETLIVTNAAGAVHPDYAPGDLMMLTDHLNLLGMAGENPLRGPNLEELPAVSQTSARAMIVNYIRSHGKQPKKQGLNCGERRTSAWLARKSSKPRQDLRFLRGAGVDAVGMSTVPEATVARYSGMRVLGVSGISNKANLDGETITTHEEYQSRECFGAKINRFG